MAAVPVYERNIRLARMLCQLSNWAVAHQLRSDLFIVGQTFEAMRLDGVIRVVQSENSIDASSLIEKSDEIAGLIEKSDHFW